MTFGFSYYNQQIVSQELASRRAASHEHLALHTHRHPKRNSFAGHEPLPLLHAERHSGTVFSIICTLLKRR